MFSLLPTISKSSTKSIAFGRKHLHSLALQAYNDIDHKKQEKYIVFCI